MLDLAFARFLSRYTDGDIHGIVPRSAAWLIQRIRQGDSCLELERCASCRWFDEQEASPPPLDDWCRALLSHPCVARAPQRAPLVLDGHRLYLHRHYRAEERIAAWIRQSLEDTHGLCSRGEESPGEEFGGLDEAQRQAVLLAARRKFAVIAGGPGTGKTTSLLHLLWLLLGGTPQMRISLAAPTGKAAARMQQALLAAQKRCGSIDPKLRARLPRKALTLHRLLDYDGRRFRYHAERPLPVDCLVVDEASMIDLAMMDRILQALPASARLILLGDPNQLAPVEAGCVLRDITGPSQRRETRAQPAIGAATVFLHRSHRFDAEGGIARLGKAILEGDEDGVVHLFGDARGVSAELHWRRGWTPSQLAEAMAEVYASCYRCSSMEEVFEALERVRLLTPVHDGPWGDVWLNARIASLLRQKGWLGEDGHGTLLMVMRNQVELGLYNGDTGLLWRAGDATHTEAWFPKEEGSMLRVPLHLLSHWQAAWSISVHKSQGSEYERVWLALPNAVEALSTRELLYTALTRARKSFTLVAEEAGLRRCVRRTMRRGSGLAQRLGW